MDFLRYWSASTPALTQISGNNTVNVLSEGEMPSTNSSEVPLSDILIRYGRRSDPPRTAHATAWQTVEVKLAAYLW